ncbi:type VI secretion system baseplate subunit TssK [Sandaracinus amylolyticus]|uniref:type VI secretion system baseplate subunit TssK n=1 Tax=Sandaracinus amylolyticus TaxID=927083 RepID=UPI001F159822|nr:type VI secretion system baseplate subunit TssK [Sandaracinus amylolyticus]UJR78605.1 Type VI secretion system baseplate subunit TssK [Sandaracinus amylolyticus]
MNRSTQLKVLWTEGLLMGPQHLQQSDRYHESLVAQRLDALEPNNWGVVRCELDRHALGEGTVRLDAFVGVMPDGGVLAMDADHPEAPPSRPVEGLGADRATLDVYLALPREREGQAQVGARARYTAHARRIADVITSGGEPAEVELALRNVRFVFGHEPREDLETIKIAEVRRESQGRYVLDESYVPPSLQIGASPVLTAWLERLVERMHTRRRSLLDARRERDAHTVEADATDVTRFVLLHALSAALPALTHFATSGDRAPRELYLRLLDLVGALSAFTIDASLEVPEFDPLDLRATFRPLFDRLERILGDTHRETCLVIDLEGREDGMHFGQIDDRITRCDRFLLAVRTSVPAKDVATLLPSIGKVASWQQVTQVVNAAMPGAKLEIAHRPPPEVPVKAGEIYFTIEARGSYWSEIAKERAIAVFLPRPFEARHTRVSLLALPPRGAQPAASDHHARA